MTGLRKFHDTVIAPHDHRHAVDTLAGCGNFK
jgi:hypothetical protein